MQTVLFIRIAGGWMTAEAITFFARISRNALECSYTQRLRLRRLNYIVGWVTPAIIVAFSATFGFITETYMEKITADNIVIALGYPTVKLYSYCWISAQHRTRIPAVILPLACFWLFNFFVTVKAVLLVARLKRQEKSFQRRCSLHKDESLSDTFRLNFAVSALRALLLLLPTLGIPWIFGFLSGTNLNRLTIGFQPQVGLYGKQDEIYNVYFKQPICLVKQ